MLDIVIVGQFTEYLINFLKDRRYVEGDNVATCKETQLANGVLQDTVLRLLLFIVSSRTYLRPLKYIPLIAMKMKASQIIQTRGNIALLQ